MGGQKLTSQSTREKSNSSWFSLIFWMIPPFLCSSPPSFILWFLSETWMIGWLGFTPTKPSGSKILRTLFFKREPRPFRSRGRPAIFWTCGEKSTPLHRIHEGYQPNRGRLSIVGVYIPMVRIPYRRWDGGMTIPPHFYATFDHGTREWTKENLMAVFFWVGGTRTNPLR